MVATWQQVLWVPFRWIWQPGWLECSSQIDNLYLAITTFPYWNDIFHTLQQEFCSKFPPDRRTVDQPILPPRTWCSWYLYKKVYIDKYAKKQTKPSQVSILTYFDTWETKKSTTKEKATPCFFFSGDSKWTSLSWMKFFQNWNFGTTVLNGLMESTTIRSPCWSAVAPGLELGDTIPF